ncbi:MAG: hypothetical protein ACLSCR_12445 [Akkermansia sp.]
MSTSTKIFVGVLIVIVMGLTSLWGVYAPTFSEAYVLPVQMTDASGATLGNFQCRPVAAENGKTLLVFRDRDFLRQTTAGMVHSRIILSYKGVPFLKAPCRGRWRLSRFPPPACRPRTGVLHRIEAPVTAGNSAEAPVMALLPEGRRFLYTKGEIVCFYRVKR